jgi:hypothetical protein
MLAARSNVAFLGQIATRLTSNKIVSGASTRFRPNCCNDLSQQTTSGYDHGVLKQGAHNDPGN